MAPMPCGGHDGAPRPVPVGLVVGPAVPVVGAGWPRKIAGLLTCGAAVTVVAPEAHVAIGALADSGAIAGHRRTHLSTSSSGPTAAARRPTTHWWSRPPGTARSTSRVP